MKTCDNCGHESMQSIGDSEVMHNGKWLDAPCYSCGVCDTEFSIINGVAEELVSTNF